jgi:hypothetical protein
VTPLRVFIGFDPRQPLAYTVAAHSAAVNCSKPVAIAPLIQRQLPVKRKGLTEFTFTRYLVPWLCDYEGYALFIDADMLVLGDLAELPWEMKEAVAVVPHAASRLNGQSLGFERASVMLFHCAECRALTPEYIETGTPQKFEWARSVFHLAPEWNHLVGYDPRRQDAKIVHYTMGIPCFPETMNDEYSQEWQAALRAACDTCSWEEIMGDSVHARYKQQRKAVGSFLAMQGLG